VLAEECACLSSVERLKRILVLGLVGDVECRTRDESCK